MSFFALVLALLIEQARPLSASNAVHEALTAWVRWVARQADNGQLWHARLAWGASVVAPALLAGVVFVLLGWFSAVLAFAWLVLVLYLTLGFRQFSHHFTQVRDALHNGQEATARESFVRWFPGEVPSGSSAVWIKPFLAYSVVSAHRHVFGVITAFLLLWWLGLGPAGAVLYRLAEYTSRQWVPGRERAGDPGPSEALQRVTQGGWRWVDWLPARATASAFAVVGNFEEAVASWRGEAAAHGPDGDGVVLAAAAGALNVRLVDERELPPDGPSASRPEPAPAHLSSTVGLVWRSVVLAMLLLALLGLARLPL